MAKPLEPEFKFYLSKQDEFVRQYNGKFIVIKGQDVLGVFNDEMSAITETQKKHRLGTFLVQKVDPGSDSYTSTFHSRVVFA